MNGSRIRYRFFSIAALLLMFSACDNDSHVLRGNVSVTGDSIKPQSERVVYSNDSTRRAEQFKSHFNLICQSDFADQSPLLTYFITTSPTGNIGDPGTSARLAIYLKRKDDGIIELRRIDSDGTDTDLATCETGNPADLARIAIETAERYYQGIATVHDHR